MSKMSIERHRECLENWSKNLEDERLRIDRILDSYKRSLAQYEFYRMQISKAELADKVSFDSERYMVKKAKPGGVSE